MRIATIDIGSYSVRLTVADVENHDINLILEKGRITSLASGVREKGVLSEDRIEETLRVLEEYKEDIDRLGANKVIAVATEALRKAKNAQDFLEEVRKRTGIEVQIITPEQEGELAFLATAYSLRPRGKFLVIDQGGGSTEFIFGEDFNIEDLTSLPMGIVNLTERFIKHDPPTQTDIEELMSYLETHIKPLKREVNEIVGLGGTITTLVALELNLYPYDPKKVHGYRLSKESIEKWFNILAQIPYPERSKRYKQIEDKRAQVILAGIAMFIKVLDIFEKDSLLVGDWGVKHGLIVRELLSQERT